MQIVLGQRLKSKAVSKELNFLDLFDIVWFSFYLVQLLLQLPSSVRAKTETRELHRNFQDNQRKYYELYFSNKLWLEYRRVGMVYQGCFI